MHIGFLSIESPFVPGQGGGIAAYLRPLIPALVQAGHRVTLIAKAKNPEIIYQFDKALRIVHTPLPNLHWYLAKLPVCGESLAVALRQMEWSFKFYRTAHRIFAEDPCDVLEASEDGALLIARYLPVPLVARLHGTNYLFRKSMGEPLRLGDRWNYGLIKMVLRRARAVTVPSQFLAQELSKDLGWPRERIRVIPNPIAPGILARAAGAGPQEPRRGDPVYVLYSGRLAPVKGIRPLLDTVKQVQEALPDVRFVLIGPWQMPESPEKLGLKKNGSESGSLLWLGHVPWETLADWYRRARLFVMPSYCETFGISVAEAMAYGLPVVATAVGALPELVQDGVSGLLVPPGDSKSLAAAILRLLQDPQTARAMGEAGRAHLLGKYTVEGVVRDTLAVYRRAAAGA